jgi:ATP-dependent helicase HrpA
MIIEAQKRDCLREIIVIASALCIQDMRVRPAEKKDAADAAHARFSDPMSDFLFYLKLWDAWNTAAGEKKSLTQLKKFCKEYFLSFVRMREWREVYEQLLGIVGKRDAVLEKSPVATYEQIHCCIASGFISHVGKKNEDGSYHIAKARKAGIFPGSALYKKKPDWVVSAELVETSRLYSRTCASMDPLWLETVAPHLCKHRYTEPFFDPETGGVKAKETVSLFGLVIVAGRTVGYGRINPAEAGEIFIREGLVAGQLQSHHAFFRHNKELRERIEAMQKKLRTSGIFAGEEAVFSFYSSRLANITSVHELNAVIKNHGSDGFLFMKESDVLLESVSSRALLFPDSVTIGAAVFPISYEFDPSSEFDGATAHIPSAELNYLNETVFDWIVPGLYTPRIQYLLEGLPKPVKRQLEPIADTSQKIAASLAFRGEDFLESVCKLLKDLHGVILHPASLPAHDFPPQLMVKVAVKKDSGKFSHNSNAAPWNHYTGKWERKNLRAWDFGDLPDIVEVVPSENGFPTFGFKGLAEKDGIVECVVFTSREKRDKNHARGVKKLLEVSLEKELAWFEKEITIDKKIELLFSPHFKKETILENLVNILKNYCFGKEPVSIWKKTDFDTMVIRIKKEISSEGARLITGFQQLGRDCSDLQIMIKSGLKNNNSKGYIKVAEELRKELGEYVERFANNTLNFNLLVNYPRYLKAFAFRIQRAFSDIGKYLPRHEIAKAYSAKSNLLMQKLSSYQQEYQNSILDFVVMVEEFKISLFAQQEVKTLFPVSQKRLDEKLEEIKKAGV